MKIPTKMAMVSTPTSTMVPMTPQTLLARPFPRFFL